MNPTSISRLRKSVRWASVIFLALVLGSPLLAVADSKEDATAVVDRWSAAYSANDPEAVVKTYRPDAILLGTVSPVISQGTEAIRAYYSKLKGSGNKNKLGERHTMVLGDNAVIVTGFYDFTAVKDNQFERGPARYTMLLIKDGDEWLIAHHHSSPRGSPGE